MSTKSSPLKKSSTAAKNKKVVAVSGARKTSEGGAVDHFAQVRIKEVKRSSEGLCLLMFIYQ